MEEKLPQESFLRERGKALQLSFEQALSASVVEGIVQRLADSDYAEKLLFYQTGHLQTEAYQHKVSLNLEYFIKQDEKTRYTKKDIGDLCAALFRNDKTDALVWSYSIKSQNGAFHVNLSAVFESVKIPVKLKISCVELEHIRPEKRELNLPFYNRKVSVLCFPAAELITLRFIEIMQKLELLNEISYYDDIYRILKSEMISGRNIWELLSEGCKKNEIPIEEGRLELLLDYRKNRYMLKKWKSYLRHEKKDAPSWDEVMDVFESFFRTIWNNMCRNVVYLGDWMPELGRFID